MLNVIGGLDRFDSGDLLVNVFLPRSSESGLGYL